MHHPGLRFDRPVPSGGYVWWYVDALSDDGVHGLTLIAFVGSVFSPYYAWARRRGDADPSNYCALNVALYGARAARWSMTERNAASLARTQDHLAIGPSALEWRGDALRISIDERCSPLPMRVRGSVTIRLTALGASSFVLDSAGLHRWTPYAPRARVEVQLGQPALSWSGVGYFDGNCGAEPLENAFRDWTWSRASLPHSTVVLYDVNPRNSPRHSLALRFAEDAIAHDIEPPPQVRLPTTRWRLGRETRADGERGVRVLRTLEDAPFYSRSLLETRLLGESAPAVHESLDLDRFRSRWVQCLLPFRMPRSIF